MRLAEVKLYVCPMESPKDLRAFQELFDGGVIDARDVVAVVGKTEGTGLSRDIGREVVHDGIAHLLRSYLGGIDDVEDRVSIILSGGTPGVLTPHINVFVRVWHNTTPPKRQFKALTIGRARSERILAEEIGRMGQIRKVAAAVRAAQADAGIIDTRDIHLVLVKGPSLTASSVEEARRRGADTVTTDLSLGPEGAMCYANDGAALGVALGVGEIPEIALTDDAVRHDWTLFSEVAMTSSAGEKNEADVVLLGNTEHSLSRLRIGHAVMTDLLDAEAVSKAIQNAGSGGGHLPEHSSVLQVFAKFVIPGDDVLRGHRIALHDDVQAFATVKAVGGAIVATAVGRTTVWVSGGERNSHQGPPGGNPVAAIITIDE